MRRVQPWGRLLLLLLLGRLLVLILAHARRAALPEAPGRGPHCLLSAVMRLKRHGRLPQKHAGTVQA